MSDMSDMSLAARYTLSPSQRKTGYMIVLPIKGDAAKLTEISHIDHLPPKSDEE